MGKRDKSPAVPGTSGALRLLWLLLWTAALLALAWAPDEQLVRYKLLALEGAAWTLVLSLGVAALSGAWSERVRTPLDGAVAAYGAAGLFFFALSPERAVSLPELTRTLFVAAVFFAATQTLPRLDARLLSRIWVCSAATVALYALLQLRGGIGPLRVPQDPRPFATFGNPIFLGAYLSASLCVAAALAAAETGAWRNAAAVMAALCAAGLWATQSRAAFAGIAAAAALWGVRSGPGRARAAAGLALLSLAGGGAFLFHQRAWTHGLIWRDSVRLWLAHPWLGCGLGRYHVEFPAFASTELRALWPQERVIVNFAHNEYLQVLAETGLAGLAALLAVVGAFTRWAWRDWPAIEDAPRRTLCAGLAAAATSLWVQAAVSPDLRFGVSSFIAFFAMAAAVAWGSGKSEPASPRWRAAAPATCAFFVAGWGWAAAEPFLAQRRLAREPSFHVDAGPEVKAQLERLEARLSREPSNAEVAEQLAYLYAKERAWEPAIRRYVLVTQLVPRRAGPYNNLGNLYYSIGDRAHAIEYWGKSVELKPDQLDAHLNLGKTLYEAGRLKESARHLETALRLDPENEKARVLLRKMVE